jgi:hypothetical protein
LGLAILTRYSSLVFIPFLLFQKKIKFIFSSYFALFLTTLPWFLYNFNKTGNFFTSISDQYANNIL